MFSYFRKKRLKTTTNIIYGKLLILTLVALILDITTAFSIHFAQRIPLLLNYVILECFFIVQLTLAFMSTLYIVSLTDSPVKPQKQLPIKLYFTLFFFILGILLFNIFNKGIFYFDEAKAYHHGHFYLVYFTLTSIFLFLDMLYPLIRRKQLLRDQIFIVPAFSIIVISASIFQYYYPYIFVNIAAIVLADFMMYTTLQKPEESYDSLTNVYARHELDKQIETLIQKKKDFQLIIIDIENTGAYNKALGESLTDEIIAHAASILDNIAPNKLVFRIEGDIFAILLHDEKEMYQTLEELARSFPATVTIRQKKITINIHKNYINTLKNISNIIELYEIIFLCNSMSKGEYEMKGISAKELSDIKSYNNIEKLLTTALKRESIEINLQPFYDTKTETFTGAESLVRLIDNDGNYLSPGKFIPIAEENSLMNSLDMIMFKKTCQVLSVIKKEHPDFTISCNLSVHDFLSEDLVKNIFAILDTVDINPKNLILELTENISSVSPNIKETMATFKERKIKLAMDDFGMGFSNYEAILRLPFDVFKIDRTLLLLCEQSPQYQIIIKNLVNALKTLNRTVIIEGVETKEQSLMAIEMGVTLHQGFLYSRPIPPVLFYKVINNPPKFDFLATNKEVVNS